MGLLVPIDHPRRASIEEVGRLALVLGSDRVSLDGIRPVGTDIDRIVALLLPDSETTIRIEHGDLPLPEIEAVATVACGTSYLDFKSIGGNLRLWDDRALVHVWRMPLGGVDEAARIASEVLGVELPAAIGRHTIAPYRVDFLLGDRLACDLETTDRDAAIRLFRRIAGPRTHIYATIMRPSAAQLAVIPALLHATHGDVTIDAAMTPALVDALQIPFDRWQIDDLEYVPDEHLIRTWRVAPVSDADADAWIARIDSAWDQVR